MLAVIIVAALAICVGLEVVMRYFFGAPTRWVIEFSEYSLLWLAFLAGAWILRAEGHVRVEMLTETLSPRWQRRAHFVTSWLGAGVCAVFCWVSATTCSACATAARCCSNRSHREMGGDGGDAAGARAARDPIRRRAFRPPPAAGLAGA